MNTCRKIKYLVISCSLFIFLASCKKDFPQQNEINSTPLTFSQVFDSFWNSMNKNYLYWDVDTTNWDEVYKNYKPVFAKLSLQNDSDVLKSVSYFRQMTAGLIDSHYMINFVPSSIVDSFLFPSLNRKKKLSTFHSPFLFISVDSNYLDRGFTSGNYISIDNVEISALSGIIRNKILYFYCTGFALNEAYNSNADNGVKTTLQYFFSKLNNLQPNIKGLIIDVRNNSGGNLADLNFFVGKLIDKPILFGYTHYKNGNGRLDFTPWIAATATPQLGAKALTIPIILLADNYSVSVAEAVTMAIRTLPNSTFVGESTWGATGPITSNNIYNDGPFTIPSFLSVYTSSAAFKYKDGKRYEGIGFPSDINVPFNFNELYIGNDPQLNKAISLIP